VDKSPDVRLSFTVHDKPPRKSQWGGGQTNASLIIKLRKAALESRRRANLASCLTTKIRLRLTVFAPNIDDRDYRQTDDNDPKRYVGDLDSLIAGVCDYISRCTPSPGENSFEPSPLFNSEPDISPTIPILINDDSQIQSVAAQKITSESMSYTVEIETT